MQVLTEDIELAGEVLHDLCAALGQNELESVAEFPQEFEAFRAVLLRVDEYNATRLHMTAEMADQSNSAKTLVIRAEDARILGDIKAMRATYAELYALNGELIGEYTKRANNHEQLLAALKEVRLLPAASHLTSRTRGGRQTQTMRVCGAPPLTCSHVHSPKGKRRSTRHIQLGSSVPSPDRCLSR